MQFSMVRLHMFEFRRSQKQEVAVAGRLYCRTRWTLVRRTIIGLSGVMCLDCSYVGFDVVRTNRSEFSTMQIDMVTQLCNGVNMFFDVLRVRRCHLHIMEINVSHGRLYVRVVLET
jgi:hypothetical protein